MIRVYFDWCILTELKKGENALPEFQNIISILRKNRNDITVPYSFAHISDLIRGYKKSDKGKKFTDIDLEYLSQVTRNHCLFMDTNSQKVLPGIHDPGKYFEELLSTDKIWEDLQKMDWFGNDCDTEEFQLVLTSLKDASNSIPLVIEEKNIEEWLDKFPLLRKVFKNTLIENSNLNLLMDMIYFIFQASNHSKLYNQCRAAVRNLLEFEKGKSLQTDLFPYVNSKLENPLVNVTFFDLLNLAIPGSMDDSQFDFPMRYRTAYILLDLIGYSFDRKETKLNNMFEDINHTFFGGYCDIFVTNDKDAYRKANALYEYFGLTSRVCLPSDFPQVFAELNGSGDFNEGGDKKQLTDQIVRSFKKGIIVEEKFDESEIIQLYKLEELFLSYFDRMQCHKLENQIYLLYYKKRSLNTSLVFWSELDEIFKKLQLLFKSDLNHPNGLTDAEKYQIKNLSWQGLRISVENAVLCLNYNSEFGLSITILISQKSNKNGCVIP